MQFKDKKEYGKWIDEQDWYQTIELPSGFRTSGKVPTNTRASFFKEIDFENKSVLDVGCNSGQYCFFAKDGGAAETIGVDINKKRIKQAQILAENEGYEITFKEQGVFDLDTSRKFDIVLCIAVLTEIQDIFGAIEQLKKVIGERAYIELNVAKPIVYASYSKEWLKGYENMSRRTAVAEVRKSKMGGWVVSPSLDVLKAVFGPDFTIKLVAGGVRYDMIEVVRTPAT